MLSRRTASIFCSSFRTALLSFSIFAASATFATDRHWIGSSGTNWSTTGNWDTAAPGSSDNAVFDSTFTNQPNLTGATTIGGIWMTGSVGQNVTISGSTTLTLNDNTINGTAGLGILLDNTNAFTLTTNAPLKLGNAQTWRNNSGNLLTIGAVDTNANSLTIDGSGNTTIAGVISSGGSIIKSGTGTLTLSGANTYTGTTTVNAGSFFVNGSTASGSAITVNSSGTILGGSGTINGSVNVASSGAVLAPGASGVGTTAILHTGALTLTSGSNLKIDINGSTAGSGYDQIISSGGISLTGATLVVSALPSVLALGNKYFIVEDSATAVNTYGSFSNGATVTDSSGDIFTINYADNGDGGLIGNDISLTVTFVVPEPGTWFVSVLLAAATLCLQWRRLIRRLNAAIAGLLENKGELF